eukprot:1264454-Amphidinium_carterae.1
MRGGLPQGESPEADVTASPRMWMRKRLGALWKSSEGRLIARDLILAECRTMRKPEVEPSGGGLVAVGAAATIPGGVGC